MKHIKTLASLALGAALLSSPASYAQELKYALEVVEGDVQDIYAKEFKRRIEEKTNGDININIYYYGTLGESGDITELTADAVVHFANASTGHLGSLVPELQMFSIPFILSDNADVNAKLLSESPVIYDKLAEDFEKKDIKLMTMYPEGNEAWISRKSIQNIQDFENFKMRVLVSPMTVEAYKSYGGSPTPMAFGEVYGGLQLKQIDGMTNPISSIQAMKFYEVADHLIWPQQGYFLTTIITGSDWFSSQSAERQALIQDTFKETSQWLIKNLSDIESDFMDQIRAARPEIQEFRFDETVRDQFRQASMSTRATYKELTGERGQQLLEEFLAERESLENQ